jgi:hypothetical protein
VAEGAWADRLQAVPSAVVSVRNVKKKLRINAAYPAAHRSARNVARR